MIYVYFSYSNDAECLAASMEFMSKVDPEAKFAVFDDGASPMVNPPAGIDFYKITNFDRAGNLNGLECIDAILGSFVEAMDALGDDWVVKIDCDVMAMRPPIANASGFWGAEGGNWGYACGICYGISRSMAQKVRDKINGRKWHEERYPEDEIITRMAGFCGGVIEPYGQRLVGDAIGFDEWQLTRHVGWAKEPQAVAIHFGRQDIGGKIRGRAAAGMRLFSVIYWRKDEEDVPDAVAQELDTEVR